MRCLLADSTPERDSKTCPAAYGKSVIPLAANSSSAYSCHSPKSADCASRLLVPLRNLKISSPATGVNPNLPRSP